MPDSQDVTQWRVLIVDDDQDNQTLAAEYLKYVGATVVTARDGLEGLAAAREFSPTIILSDLSMPNMDGWTMFAKLRADASLASIPVIALTAHAMPQDRDRVLEAGFDGYVTKPFMFRVLVAEMKRWLSRRDQQPGESAVLLEVSAPAAKAPDAKTDKAAASKEKPDAPRTVAKRSVTKKKDRTK